METKKNKTGTFQVGAPHKDPKKQSLLHMLKGCSYENSETSHCAEKHYFVLKRLVLNAKCQKNEGGRFVENLL